MKGMEGGYGPRRKNASPRIMGANSVGVEKELLLKVNAEVQRAFMGRGVSVKGVRFVPESRVDLGKGVFQVIANTVVEIERSGTRLAPLGRRKSKAYESVLTVEADESGHQTLRKVSIPALER